MEMPNLFSTMKPTVQSSGRWILNDVCSNRDPLKYTHYKFKVCGYCQILSLQRHLPLATCHFEFALLHTLEQLFFPVSSTVLHTPWLSPKMNIAVIHYHRHFSFSSLSGLKLGKSYHHKNHVTEIGNRLQSRKSK